jgi:hypothetical protein
VPTAKRSVMMRTSSRKSLRVATLLIGGE